MSQARDNGRLTLPVTARDHIQGAMDAPVVLVEYGDYQCPYSGRAYLIVKEIQRRLGEKLCFVFRHFPLTQIHPQAQKAAEVAEAAAAQGKFWQMHDTLFEHQQALEDAYLIEYAVMLDLDTIQLLRDMSAHVYAQRVQEDINSGASSGVSRTPTFFINNICCLDAWDLERMLAAIVQANDLRANVNLE